MRNRPKKLQKTRRKRLEISSWRFDEHLFTWLLRSKFRVNLDIVEAEGSLLSALDKDGALLPKDESISKLMNS